MDGQKIRDVRALAEKKLGFRMPDEVADEVLRYAKQKCELNGKSDSYLLLLYENELTDYFMRLVINLKGEMNCVRRLQTVSM